MSIKEIGIIFGILITVVSVSMWHGAQSNALAETVKDVSKIEKRVGASEKIDTEQTIAIKEAAAAFKYMAKTMETLEKKIYAN